MMFNAKRRADTDDVVYEADFAQANVKSHARFEHGPNGHPAWLSTGPIEALYSGWTVAGFWLRRYTKIVYAPVWRDLSSRPVRDAVIVYHPVDEVARRLGLPR